MDGLRGSRKRPWTMCPWSGVEREAVVPGVENGGSLDQSRLCLLVRQRWDAGSRVIEVSQLVKGVNAGQETAMIDRL